MNRQFIKLKKGTKLYSGKIGLFPKIWLLDVNKLKDIIIDPNIKIITATLVKDVHYINIVVQMNILNDPDAIQKRAIFLIRVTPQLIALGFSDTNLLKIHSEIPKQINLLELLN